MQWISPRTSLCLSSLPQVRGCAWLCCLKSQLGRARTESALVSCSLPALQWSNLCWPCQLPSPGHSVSQPGTPAPGCKGERSHVALGYRPVTVQGSCSMRLPSPLLGLGNSGEPQASCTASSDDGLEARVTAQANSQELAWSEERKGLRSIPKTWICLERFKKWGFSNNLVSQDTGVLYLH